MEKSYRWLWDLSISDIDERADFVINFVKAEKSKLSLCSLSVPAPFREKQKQAVHA